MTFDPNEFGIAEEDDQTYEESLIEQNIYDEY